MVVTSKSEVIALVNCDHTDRLRKKWFVMEYIDPALLDGHKFDLRSYLLVASLNPLLVFYHDGFVRRVIMISIC